MGVTAISPEQAWSEGSSLWILTNEKSPSLSRTDWLLNFQISKSLLHSSRPVASQVSTILEKTGLPTPPALHSVSKNLLISAHLFLPAQWVSVIDLKMSDKGAIDHQSWITETFKVWNQLAKPSMRVFLPKSMEISFFQKAWKKLTTDDVELTIVNTGHLKSLNPGESKS